MPVAATTDRIAPFKVETHPDSDIRSRDLPAASEPTGGGLTWRGGPGVFPPNSDRNTERKKTDLSDGNPFSTESPERTPFRKDGAADRWLRGISASRVIFPHFGFSRPHTQTRKKRSSLAPSLGHRLIAFDKQCCGQPNKGQKLSSFSSDCRLPLTTHKTDQPAPSEQRTRRGTSRASRPQSGQGR